MLLLNTGVRERVNVFVALRSDVLERECVTDGQDPEVDFVSDGEWVLESVKVGVGVPVLLTVDDMLSVLDPVDDLVGLKVAECEEVLDAERDADCEPVRVDEALRVGDVEKELERV